MWTADLCPVSRLYNGIIMNNEAASRWPRELGVSTTATINIITNTTTNTLRSIQRHQLKLTCNKRLRKHCSNDSWVSNLSMENNRTARNSRTTAETQSINYYTHTTGMIRPTTAPAWQIPAPVYRLIASTSRCGITLLRQYLMKHHVISAWFESDPRLHQLLIPPIKSSSVSSRSLAHSQRFLAAAH